MPELPEIETLAAQLRPLVSGLVLSRISIGPSDGKASSRAVEAGLKRVLKTPKLILEQKLPGKKIEGVVRRGKFLAFQIEGALSLWFHLGMTGQLLWGAEKKDRHSHVVLEFQGSDVKLTFRDIRKFGKIFLTNGTTDTQPDSIRLLGPEPSQINAQAFALLFKKRTGRIKSLLLNQRILAGLGNIYTDESLFRAGIDPRRRACKIPLVKLEALHTAVKQTLNEAIAHGGSSIDDYVHADGQRGGFQKLHRVYGRFKKSCIQCKTLIKRVRLAGRSSFFCPQCQT